MNRKTHYWTVIGFVILSLNFFTSCEKNSIHPIDGTWEHHIACDCSYGGFFFPRFADYEVLYFRDKSVSRFYGDSLAYSNDFTISDTLLIYGQNDFTYRYFLQNDTLILISLPCDSNIYVRKK